MVDRSEWKSFVHGEAAGTLIELPDIAPDHPDQVEIGKGSDTKVAYRPKERLAVSSEPVQRQL